MGGGKVIPHRKEVKGKEGERRLKNMPHHRIYKGRNQSLWEVAPKEDRGGVSNGRWFTGKKEARKKKLYLLEN